MTDIKDFVIENDVLIKYVGSSENVVIPDFIIGIGKNAFWENRTIKSITIPNSVTSIGENAFFHCTSLSKLDYLGTIDQWVQVQGCANVLGYTENLHLNGKLLTSATVTSTKIEDGAFYKCKDLKSVNIENGVTSIGNAVFYNCKNLEGVQLPNSISSVGSNVFYGCEKMAFIKEDDLLYLGNETNPFLCLIKAEYITITSVRIDEKCKIIANAAFFYCSDLTSVTLSDSVERIGNYAFGYCNLLSSIFIPQSVTSIGQDAFLDCEKLSIFCHCKEKPSEWNEDWNSSNCPVQWASTNR